MPRPPSARGRHAQPVHLARVGVAVALLLLISLLAAGGPAHSHVTLAAASPAPESTSTGLPRHVRLRFVVPAVADPRTDVVVSSPSGVDLADGTTAVTDLGVGQEVSASSETGWFHVHYRVVLWGGHVDQGDFRFLVEPADGGHSAAWLWGGGALLVLGAVHLLHRTVGRRAVLDRSPTP
jgi:methionine-rich copper-binding protein CopC